MKLKSTSRIPILLSAFVCPGAGQFIQGRWIAGALFSITFSAAFVIFMVIAGALIISYYRMGFEFETYEPNIQPDRLIPAFIVAITIYIINLTDVSSAHFRACRRNTKEHSV